jgi:anti-sigma factor RsiW
MDDLIALRDGEGSAWARQHVPACPACQTDLEALYQRVAQLKALPALRPARDRWPAVRAQVRAQRVRRRRVWSSWSLAAAAAMAGVLLLRPAGGGSGNGELHAQLAEVKQQSAVLEDELQRYDLEGRVLSGRAAALVAELEDRIGMIDGTLARRAPALERDPALVRLWQERVDLMRELVNVRATRARYVGL